MTNNDIVTNFKIVTTHLTDKGFPDCRCDTCYEKEYYMNGCTSTKINNKFKRKLGFNFLKDFILKSKN